MSEYIRQEARKALAEGFDGVLGLKDRWGQIGPYLFRNQEEVQDLETDPKFGLAKTIRIMLKRRPDLKIAAVLRGCDVRALQELEDLGEISTGNLRYLGISCSLEQAALCNCPKPVYDTAICTGCWKCVETCPEKAIARINTCPILQPSEYNSGLADRKAIYIPYAQAVPLKATRDREHCLVTTGAMECKGCENVCQAEAIIHDDQERTRDVEVGSIILSSGFQPFDPSRFDTYSYAEFKNVVTALEFERILAATGPWMGHLVRPGDEQEPKKIAFLQCVGSREMNRCDNEYCSSVCCMYAIKESVIAKEHAADDLDISIYYMDIRTPGKDFERYYEKAKDKGVRFIRSRVHTILEHPDGSLQLQYVTDDGQKMTEDYDMVVLSHGLEVSDNARSMAENMGIELTKGGFIQSSDFSPVATNRSGIYACGALAGPKDIPQSVMEASAAACAATSNLSQARHSMTREAQLPPEQNVRGDRPRVGVFVCSCGINIAGVIDVQELVEHARALPHVEFVDNNLFTCSQDTQDTMARVIREQGLNRVVVAACTPKTHEPVFQETLQAAGLNKYLFEMANIRNQDSWVHGQEPATATRKAKELIGMAVNKVLLNDPLEEVKLDITPAALVIGGGLAGMNAAVELAGQGFQTHLVEQDSQLGGIGRTKRTTVHNESIQTYLSHMTRRIEEDPLIQVHLQSKVSKVSGFVGNFASTVTTDGRDTEIEHGAVIIATGAREHTPEEYGYGQDKRIMTNHEIEQALGRKDLDPGSMDTAVFIQCVGSREPQRQYCSRICCTQTLKTALEFKEVNPDIQVFVLYRDIRTYGERESLYKEARARGIIFVRFDPENKPEVSLSQDTVQVSLTDPLLGEKLNIQTDLVGLASAVVSRDNSELARMFKVPVDEDGWFLEAHQKLRPVDFATDGVFMAGTCHYPKPIEESVAQAQA
ncbi:MAG: FAD-dependent oxidoreductase, partial [Thermodesulfobacteriota bacterium]